MKLIKLLVAVFFLPSTWIFMRCVDSGLTWKELLLKIEKELNLGV